MAVALSAVDLGVAVLIGRQSFVPIWLGAGGILLAVSMISGALLLAPALRWGAFGPRLSVLLALSLVAWPWLLVLSSETMPQSVSQPALIGSLAALAVVLSAATQLALRLVVWAFIWLLDRWLAHKGFEPSRNLVDGWLKSLDAETRTFVVSGFIAAILFVSAQVMRHAGDGDGPIGVTLVTLTKWPLLLVVWIAPLVIGRAVLLVISHYARRSEQSGSFGDHVDESNLSVSDGSEPII